MLHCIKVEFFHAPVSLTILGHRVVKKFFVVLIFVKPLGNSKMHLPSKLNSYRLLTFKLRYVLY